MDAHVRATRRHRAGSKPDEGRHRLVCAGSKQRGSKGRRARVTRRERRGARLANFEAIIAGSGGTRPPEQPLDALVHNKAFETDQCREREDAPRITIADPEQQVDRVPDQAEVTDVTCGREHAVEDAVTADPFELLVHHLVEALDGRAEVVLAWNGVGELVVAHAVSRSSSNASYAATASTAA